MWDWLKRLLRWIFRPPQRIYVPHKVRVEVHDT